MDQYCILFVCYRGGRATCLDGPAIGGSGMTSYSAQEAKRNASWLNELVSVGCAYIVAPLPQYVEG